MTLVVQAVNFFIFYWIMRTFLFRPVAGFLDNRKQKMDSLRAAITLKNEIIADIQLQRQKGWRDCYAYCMRNQPQKTEYEFFQTSAKVPDFKKKMVSLFDLENYTKEMTEYFVTHLEDPV